MSVEMVIIHAPVQGAPLCQPCLPFDTERLATHTASYWPVRAGGPVSAPVLLCGPCASNRRIYTNVRALPLPSGAPVSLAKRGVLAEPGRRVRVPEFILEARRGMGDGIGRVADRVTERRLDRNEPVGLARLFGELARNARPVWAEPPADGSLCADVARGCAHVARMDENGHQVGCG